MLDNLKAKYNVNPSDRRKEIVRLQKKYNLYKEVKYEYKLKPNEIEMFVEKQHSISYLFIPDESDEKYKELIEKILDNGKEGNRELTSLYNLSSKLPDNISKSIASLLKRANTCKEKMLEKLSAIDKEDKSEKLTEIYLKQMTDSIQKLLELSMLKTEEEWKQVGKILNSYLYQLGFFIPDDIEDSVQSQYIDTSLSHPKTTKEKENHGKIEYFNSLPYCIHYFDSLEKKPEMISILGICTYYKYKE